MSGTGIHAFLDLLAGYGVRHIFGNPGTTEMPLNDALVGDRRFQYILGLQEVPVMAMADGYAMASRSLGVVNLHISCGLGNAMGMLYNAYREGTPLLVTAGQQDRRLKFEEPILWGDMVSVARPWTKWAAEVSEPGTTHGRLGFPADHPLYAQGLPLWSPEIRERLAEFDVLLVTGMDLLRQYVYHEPARAMPEHIRLVHLDEDPYQINKNYPVEVGL